MSKRSHDSQALAPASEDLAKRQKVDANDAEIRDDQMNSAMSERPHDLQAPATDDLVKRLKAAVNDAELVREIVEGSDSVAISAAFIALLTGGYSDGNDSELRKEKYSPAVTAPERLSTSGKPSSMAKQVRIDHEEDENESQHARNKNWLRYAAALCANSFVKFFKADEWDRTVLRAFWDYLPGIRIQRLMIVDCVDKSMMSGRAVVRPTFKFEQRIVQRARNVESLLMKSEWADLSVELLQLLKERGVRRLAVRYPSTVDNENRVRAFCVGGPETADESAPGRSMYLRLADLSFDFLQQLAQECLAADARRMPTVTFYRYRDFVPPLPEHISHARHMKDDRPCLHFRLDAPAGPYEIVAQSRGNKRWKVTLRGGHSAVPHCAKMSRRDNWFRELEYVI